MSYHVGSDYKNGIALFCLPGTIRENLYIANIIVMVAVYGSSKLFLLIQDAFFPFLNTQMCRMVLDMVQKHKAVISKVFNLFIKN